MGFVPVEKLTKIVENPYEAILVAAKDARIQNSINALKDLDPSIEHPKVTSVSLRRLITGKIEYYYSREDEDETSDESQAEESDASDGS